MIAPQEVMDALKAIGLNLYERKLWVALLSRGVSTAGELAEISGVPRSRAYDVLESLAEKGFVLIKPSKPMQYVAIEPKDALERVKERMLEETRKKMERIDKLKNSPIGKELERIYKEGIELVNPEEMMAAIKGRHLMHKHLSSMLKKARKSVKIVAPANTVKEVVQAHGQKLKKLKKKGVEVKIVTNARPRDPEMDEIASTFAVKTLHGVEDLEKLTSGFILVDDSEALLEASHEKSHPSQHSSIWLSSKHIAKNVLRHSFDAIWEKARELSE